MKIEYNDTKKFTRFKELKSGGIFHNPLDNLIYMKIKDIYCDDEDDEPYNAIDLSNGEAVYCVDDAKVYAVDATLYINEQKY